MKQKTLRWYLARRLFLLFSIFSLIWIWVASQVYHYAWDGTSEYYLYQDLEVALSGQLKLPYEDTGKFMGHWQDLPTGYQRTFERHGLGPDEQTREFTQLLTLGEDYVYILRYAEIPAEPLYIVHRIAGQDSPSLLVVFIALTLALFVLAALIWWPTHQRIVRESEQLTASLRSPDSNLTQFEEFASQSILAATDAYAQDYAQQQERLYSAFLSHELNTPLAQIQNTLARFGQLDELPLDALPLLTQLEQAGQDLVLLSEAILLLCRADQARLTVTELSGALISWQQTWQQQGLCIELNLPTEPVSQPVQLRLLTLLLTQLGKNALQHGEGTLVVTLDNSGMTFSNRVGQQQAHHGQGLGTQIIARVCACFGWREQHHSHSEQQFTLTIHFSGYTG
ncbi:MULTISPECIES: hypothetical protein [unclassified Pseudoalteromonas]|uniref:sensor histidine kinase n=1 Tax=unclassified Pseudoalteromonas TaxID=194690 RepID=UPI002097A9E4|nr:hypothetical protein [Pseudoalteromonas sp. XMcav2-N]MCO7190588.1 hypothetical protein [Pseudoalteromonas sp. XMcav2-N]